MGRYADDTFGALVENRITMFGHCPRCEVYRDIDLATIEPSRVYINAQFKCRDCGGRVQIYISGAAASGKGGRFE